MTLSAVLQGHEAEVTQVSKKSCEQSLFSVDKNRNARASVKFATCTARFCVARYFRMFFSLSLDNL